MIRVALLLIALVSLVAVPTAAAGARSVTDPRNDPKGSHYPGPDFYWATTGACASQWTTVATNECGDMSYSENQGGLMDIARAGHGHARGGLLVHRLTTHRRWKNGLLRDGAQISFYVSTDADAAFERRIDVGLRRGKPIFLVRNARGGVVSTGAATRPNAKTVQFSFSKRLLGPRVRHARWFAFAGIACRRAYDACGDRTPNGSLVQHHLG